MASVARPMPPLSRRRRALALLLLATFAILGGAHPARPSEANPVVVPWGDDFSPVGRQLAELKSGERVLVVAHGGDQATPSTAYATASAIQASSIGSVVDRVVLVDYLSKAPLPTPGQFATNPIGGPIDWAFDAGRYYAGAPSLEQVGFFTGVVEAIADQTGRRPDALCHGAGAVLCRRSMSAGASFESLSLVDVPIPAVNGLPLAPAERRFDRGYNFFASAPTDAAASRLGRGSPIEGMRNVDLGSLAHTGLLAQPTYIGHQTAALKDELAGSSDSTGSVGSLQTRQGCPPFCPPFPPPVGRTGDLGDLDFTPVKLTLLAERPFDGGTGMAFAVRTSNGGPVAEASNVDDGTRAAATAFAVWLKTPPASRWVNLSPSEPDRVLHPDLQGTYPGRILAEADLQLKTDSDRITNPLGPGRAYWDAMEGCSGGARSTSVVERVWITPAGPADVWVGPGTIVVGATPLRVEQRVEAARVGGVAVESFRECAQQVSNELVVPQLQQLVDEGEDYSRLRQVYASLAVAEAYKKEHASAGLFTDFKRNGDLAAFRTETAWDQGAFFQRYLSLYGKAQDITVAREDGIAHYQSGGVDLTHIDLRNMTDVDLVAERPYLRDEILPAVMLFSDSGIGPRAPPSMTGGVSFPATDPRMLFDSNSVRDIVNGIKVETVKAKVEPARPDVSVKTRRPGPALAPYVWSSAVVAPVALGLGRLLAHATRGPPFIGRALAWLPLAHHAPPASHFRGTAARATSARRPTGPATVRGSWWRRLRFW